ncbi:DNA adenine methylase [Agathobaculum sp. LCP25S3_E8]|uniref:DNA adenine methylase n=1 Tax=Agathobaculum sp. LCP25S3_E8 TaxID=3438735 RepID=UPI003F8FC047
MANEDTHYLWNQNSIDFNDSYFSTHLITYLGNKRKLLPFINSAVEIVKKELGSDRITAFDGFAGSGVVSRLLKQHTTTLYVNDFEQYSKTVNTAFLSNSEVVDMDRLSKSIDYLNKNRLSPTKSPYFISQNYAPKNDDDIQLGERVFYTHNNALAIDNIRHLIDTEIDKDLRVFCLAELIVQASIHNNTSGVFKGFHKKNGIGHFGGAGENAIERIKGDIWLEMPCFSKVSNKTIIFCTDTNQLVKELPPVDLAYYDPPYNQHPYGSNYFMLNIINGGKPVEIQNGVSGIVLDWQRSAYNKQKPAEEAFEDLIANTKAKYVLISYNNEGIVPFEVFKGIIERHGSWRLLEQDYNTYRGSRNLCNRNSKVKELLWLIKKF